MPDTGNRAKAIDKVLELLSEGSAKEDIERVKREVSAEYGLAEFIKNSEVIARARQKGMHWLVPLLKKRPMRSVSGIVNIAIMTVSGCPHGRCTYCPKGENAPNSYTGFEPATMRGIQNRFDAYAQVQARVQQLHEIGHPTDKCEVIIQGGTFLAQPKEYQEKFIKGMYDALNCSISPTLEDAMRMNEHAKNRCIG